MHYTQIASVSHRMGLLRTDSTSFDVIMSSLLSGDIRTNPDSLFTKKRAGVYALSLKGLVGLPKVEPRDSGTSVLLEDLHARTGITDRNELLNKALYLTGRTLDIAQGQEVIFYQSLELQQSIDLNVRELVKEFAVHVDELATALAYEFPRALKKAKQMACRLGLEDAALAIALSLFLLGLAIDIVGTGTVLVIASPESSTKMPVRSESQNVPTPN